jgi:hypothetical protein
MTTRKEILTNLVGALHATHDPVPVCKVCPSLGKLIVATARRGVPVSMRRYSILFALCRDHGHVADEGLVCAVCASRADLAMRLFDHEDAWRWLKRRGSLRRPETTDEERKRFRQEREGRRVVHEDDGGQADARG